MLLAYLDGPFQTVDWVTNHQIAYNFISNSGLFKCKSFIEFERYNNVKLKIEERIRKFSEYDAIELLADFGICDRYGYASVDHGIQTY